MSVRLNRRTLAWKKPEKDLALALAQKLEIFARARFILESHGELNEAER